MERLLRDARCSYDFPWSDELKPLLERGKVYVNGKVATPETKVEEGDLVKIGDKCWKAHYRLWETQLERWYV